MKDLRPAFRGLRKTDPEELFQNLKTPCFVIDEAMLRYNGKILKGIEEETGVRILLAQKCFSNYDLYPVLSEYLYGTEASGLFEARLGHEEMPGKEVHVFSAAYREDEFDEITKYADHILFNSVSQLKKFGRRAKDAGCEIGLRINPEYSTQVGHEIYDPCSAGSRLGVPIQNFESEMTEELLGMLDGIHFHTLCQQDAYDLFLTLKAVEDKFGKYLHHLKWINMGGGHHIVRPDYDVELLKKCILHVKETYHAEVYLEPGEGVVLNAGYLLSRVLDTFDKNGKSFAICDTSAACHFPDALECPFLPPLMHADIGANDKEVRLGCPTCLTGDVIGNYKFDHDLKENELLIFGDMALYTTCKTNTFNGMALPDIWILHEDKSLEKLTDFSYDDFKCRLGRKKDKTQV